jgi:hypothetical protein
MDRIAFGIVRRQDGQDLEAIMLVPAKRVGNVRLSLECRCHDNFAGVYGMEKVLSFPR